MDSLCRRFLSSYAFKYLCQTPGEGAKIAVYVVPVYHVLRISAPNFRHSTDREVALMVLMAYLSYVMAEVLLFSPLLQISILYFFQCCPLVLT